MASGRRPNVRVTTVAAVLGVVPALYEAVLRVVLRVALRRLKAGDPELVLRLMSGDVRFRFPGHSSWAADVRGRDEVARWLRRFVDIGMRLDVDDIIVSGPPWANRVCVRFTDYCNDETGKLIYLNRGTIVARVRWGRVVRYEIFVDTEKVTDLDNYLAAHTPISQPSQR
ncbi:MAG TPA: nuclear transport factor 2 family protein [Pseudonocardiaceae bacterium]|nr:nuclear transport factor 2 family protein [Pseudonocardiaceae bacterium]